MKIPSKINARTAIILSVLAIILTVSGASVFFETISVKPTGMASASVGITIAAKPSAPPTPTPTPETPGGPGNAGGAAGGGSLAPHIISYEWEFLDVASGSTLNAIVPDDVDTTLRASYFVAKEDAKRIPFKTRDYIGKPSAVSAAPGVVYTYLLAETEDFSSELLDNIRMVFRVKNTWISSNSIDAGTLIFYRHNGGGWEALETTKESADGTYTYYRSKSTGFSVFAVSGSKASSGINFVIEETVKALRGEKISYTAIIDNIGGAALTNVKLSAQAKGFEINASPEAITSIPAGSKGTYLLTIFTPESTAPGTYTVTLQASGSEASASTRFKIIVPSEAKPSLSVLLPEQILNLKSIADKIWLEAQWVGLRGGNVSKVFELLNSAKAKLTEAEKSLGMISYEETSLSVEMARADLELSVGQLAVQQAGLKIFSVSPKVIVAFLSALVLISGLVGYKIVRGRSKVAKKVEKKFTKAASERQKELEKLVEKKQKELEQVVNERKKAVQEVTEKEQTLMEVIESQRKELAAANEVHKKALAEVAESQRKAAEAQREELEAANEARKKALAEAAEAQRIAVEAQREELAAAAEARKKALAEASKAQRRKLNAASEYQRKDLAETAEAQRREADAQHNKIIAAAEARQKELIAAAEAQRKAAEAQHNKIIAAAEARQKELAEALEKQKAELAKATEDRKKLEKQVEKQFSRAVEEKQKELTQVVEDHKKAVQEAAEVEKRRAKLQKELAIIDEGYHKGLIDDETYKSRKDEIKQALSELG